VKLFYVLLFILFSLNSIFAQPVANFTILNNTISGCDNLTVECTNTSTGISSKATFKWVFGNSTTTITIKDPKYQFTSPGVYTIKLTVTDKNVSSSKTQTVTVFKSPVVQFKADSTQGCFPLNVKFSDLSVAGSSKITSWTWSFGDAGGSNQQNPQTYIYKSLGTYDVSLQVVDANNCHASLTKTKYIQTSSAPKPSFTAATKYFCAPPAIVCFKNTTVGNNLTYLWNFGNGIVKRVKADTCITYNTIGSFDVSLTATNASACSSTIINKKFIEINTFKTDFKANLNKICESSNIAFNDLSKTLTGIDKAISWSWNFGDNKTDTFQNPNHVYIQSGIYTVKLISKSSKGCKDTAVYTNLIKVNPLPIVNFNADITKSCYAPLTVKFSDLSTNVKSRIWNFGDGGPTDTTKNPTYTYTLPGIYDVSLQIISPDGCTKTLVKKAFIKIQTPQANFVSDITEGCKNLTVNFTDKSSYIFPKSTTKWYFGFNNLTSLQPNPTSIYTDTGKFDVKLVITDSLGCKDSITKEKYIMVGTKYADFTANQTTICHNTKVQFTDLSGGGKYVDTWNWDFGKTEGTSTLKNPIHKFITDTGHFTVTLITKFNGCADTLIKKNYITVNPSRSIFYAQNTLGMNDSIVCHHTDTVFFKNYSIGANFSIWNYGDTTKLDTTTTQNYISHVYKYPGFYPVTLITINTLNNCRDTLYKTDSASAYIGYIKISKLHPRYSQGMGSVCQYKSITFIDTSSYTNTALTTWRWDFGDNTSSVTNNPSISHPFNNSGIFSTKMVIQDALGCLDSITKTNNDTVHKLPSPRFTADKTNGCRPLPIIFSDQSKKVDAQIVKWNWDFGDNTPTSTLQNPPHTFLQRGTYAIKLTITDSLGCDSTLIKPNYINPTFPYPGFKIPSFICRYNSLTPQNLLDSAGIGLKYKWLFGDGESSNIINPTHFYKYIDSSTLFTITLQLSDTNNCDSTITKQLKVSQPKADFDATIKSINCPPLITKFYTKNSSPDILNYIWDFGNGTIPITTKPKDSVSHNYDIAGKYYITLLATNTDNCIDTIKSDTTVKKNYISIGGPSGSITATPLNSCAPAPVVFKVNALNAVKYDWIFQDGSDSTTTSDSVVHIYTTGGLYDYSVKLIDSQVIPCVVPINSVNQIPIISADVHFHMSSQSGCTYPAFFNVSDSSTILPNLNTLNISYSWDFGDNITATGSKISHTYKSVGTYPIKLKVKINSCEYSSSPQYFTVIDNPEIKIKATPDTAPMSYPILFSAPTKDTSKIKNWFWDFGDGVNSNQQYASYHYFSDAKEYLVKLKVVFTNLCSNTDSLTVKITQTPNAFTPFDGDGINDVFMKGVNLTILNRWGQKLYEGYEGWNGYYKGQQASPGTYFYIILIDDVKDQPPVKYTGSVTLIRK